MNNMERILKAQEQNRLLVMPCDMGDRIYIVQTSRRKYCTAVFIRPSRLSPTNVYRVCCEYGKNVFLTLEEAQEAKIRIEKEIDLKIDADTEDGQT